MPDQDFLYDDFFSPADAPGIPTTIEVRGRTLTIGLRTLSFGDARRLLAKNARIIIAPDGTPQVEMKENMDDNTDLILACVKSWPFKNRDGSMVPINEKTLDEMQPDVLTAILQKVTEVANAVLGAQSRGINGPFVKP